MDVAFWGLAVLLSMPALVVLGECVVAALPRRASHRASARPGASGDARPTIAVLVPAHNEAGGIGATIADLDSQLTADDRLLVVADNCTDETATVARVAGAEVVERSDPQRRGKGYALRYGLQALGAEPRDVVVIVDADCQIEPGALDRVARVAVAVDAPVQARYYLDPPANSDALTAISALACLIKNVVRPLGLHRLGLPCQLNGSGMAFPWHVIQRTPISTEAMAEDLELGLALARAGRPAHYCPEAVVRSDLPARRSAAMSQRRRWEHGYLAALLRDVPRLWWAAIAHRNPRLMALALDLSVPPLSLLLLLWAVALAGASAAAALGAVTWWPVMLLAAAGAMVLFATALAWLRFGREITSVGTILIAPLYVLGKVPIYLTFLTRRQRAWVRTERPEESSAPQALDVGVGSNRESDAVR